LSLPSFSLSVFILFYLPSFSDYICPFIFSSVSFFEIESFTFTHSVLFDVRQHALCSRTARVVQYFECLFRFCIRRWVTCDRKTVQYWDRCWNICYRFR